jgi:DNA-binding NtrC family response regulator
MHRANVLFVEDDAPSRRAMRSILAREGFPFCSAATLAFASEQLSWARILVLDLMLPDGNGVELLKQVRTEQLPIQVAVVTATEDKDILAQVDSLRPDHVFQKPLDIDRFTDWLRQASQRCG